MTPDKEIKEHKEKEHKEKEHKEKKGHHRHHSHARTPSSSSPAVSSPLALPSGSPALAPSPRLSPATEVKRATSSDSVSSSVLHAAQLSDDALLGLEKGLTPDASNPVRTCLLAAMAKFEQGNYSHSLEDIDETVRMIGTLCVVYVYLCPPYTPFSPRSRVTGR